MSNTLDEWARQKAEYEKKLLERSLPAPIASLGVTAEINDYGNIRYSGVTPALQNAFGEVFNPRNRYRCGPCDSGMYSLSGLIQHLNDYEHRLSFSQIADLLDELDELVAHS